MNKNYIVAIVSFLVGAVGGGLGVYIGKMNKYNRDFQKKLKQMEEYYEKNKKKEKSETKTDKETPKITISERKNMMDEARKIAAEEGYKRHYSKIMLDEDNDVVIEEDDTPIPDDVTSLAPYIIEPSQFGDQEMFEMETWSLYDDGIVTNEEDSVVPKDSIEDYIPAEAIDQLRASDLDDSIFVRNESRKTDYQIIKVVGRYADE